ncbi:MAG: response regulator [Pirellulales bacterium]
MSTVMKNERRPRKSGGRDDYNRRDPRRPAPARGDWDVKPLNILDRQRLRVLVVDDHRDGADTMSRLVGVWGHEVKQAYDGATGLALAGTYRPDVLLLDIAMPTISGLELAIHVRQQARLKNCLMIAVTGRTDATTRRQCEAAGIDLILLKPANLAELQTLLALVSDYRWTSGLDVRKHAAAAAIAQRRTGTSSLWRTWLSCDDLQVTVAS